MFPHRSNFIFFRKTVDTTVVSFSLHFVIYFSMLTFKDDTVPNRMMIPPVAAEVRDANKKLRKKRSKKKKSPSHITSTSDSSDSESELNVEVATIKPTDVHLLGAVISNPTENSVMILAQSISARLTINQEEVMKCIGWMWDQGLKYDDEESVEKCLKQQVSVWCILASLLLKLFNPCLS